MGQEYFIKSENLQQKIRQLLPSQGGAGPGVDLSATTQIVPIVDLTESAEGSDVRADLQTAFSFDTITAFSVSNTTSTIVSNTGYWRVYGGISIDSSVASGAFKINNGFTTKTIITVIGRGAPDIEIVDFIVFLPAGHSLEATTGSGVEAIGSVRQIADIDGNLISP
jgi:hypothetical protein